MICAHNYVRNFDFVPHIWGRLHDKDCLYILSSSKNSFSPLRLTNTTYSLSQFYLQRHHSLSLSHTHTHTHTHTFWLQAVNPTKVYTFHNLFLSCSAFSVRLLPASNTASEISSNPERDKQPTLEKTRFS